MSSVKVLATSNFKGSQASMQTQSTGSARKDDVERLLQYIPFFKQVQQQDEQQLQTLVAFSRVSVLDAGQTFLNFGSQDQWLYFLLRGELEVTYRADEASVVRVNKINAGEVFGEIALLLDRPRSADICVSENCRQAMIFGLDYNAFGRLTDFSLISLGTKLAFYQNVVHNLRWKLELYRSQHPDNPLASRHRQIKLSTSPRGGEEELQSLHDQAVALAQLLVEWNPSLGNDKSKG